MSNEHIGEIPLDDYLEIVGRDKGSSEAGPPVKNKPTGRVSRMVGLVLLCALCMAAGDYIAPLTGKDRSVTYEEAVALLTAPAHESWAREIGMGAAHRHVNHVLDAIHGLAMRQADHQIYASSYLRNISAKGITLLQQIEAEGGISEKVKKDLQHIRRLLGN